MKNRQRLPVPIEHYIEEANLSVAWSRAFLALVTRRGEEVAPLTLSITGFTGGVPHEDAGVRKALDACLKANDHQRVDTVANTIFPQSLWRGARGDRKKLFQDYLENLPSYVAMDPDKNRNGLYFARLIAFGVDPKTGARIAGIPIGRLPEPGNQLEFLISRCKKPMRKSMFHAAIFDPARDHIGGAQQGFPCLHHVSFVPDYDAGTLAINAFYATQQLFVKAYGNYLGLARLGAFFADQTRLELTKVTCFAGVEKMDQRPVSGSALSALITAAEAVLRPAPGEVGVPLKLVG